MANERWEYLAYSGYYMTGEGMTPNSCGGAPGPIDEVLNNLGNEGWELVLQDSEGRYIFKKKRIE